MGRDVVIVSVISHWAACDLCHSDGMCDHPGMNDDAQRPDMPGPDPAADRVQPLHEAAVWVEANPQQLEFGPLFWTSRDAVVVGDVADGRIVLWNLAAEHTFGYTATEAIGMPLEMLFWESVREEHSAIRAAYVAADIETWNGPGTLRQILARHQSGAAIVVEYTVTPFVGPDGLLYLLGVVRDVTERTRIETERDALAALKADFTSMVIHELGTPLAAVRVLTDLIDRDGITITEREHVLAMIRTETDLLQHLVADMHDLDGLERDDFAVDLRPVAVATLLVEATTAVQGQLHLHAFQVEPAPHVQVSADPYRIGQVLRNLLGNAARHTPPGTSVTLQARQVEGRLRIEVADQGPGIHPDDLARVFEKFGRGRDTSGHRVHGTGLGLYLSHRIVQAHGGDLVVESAPGMGATFAFDLKEVPST